LTPWRQVADGLALVVRVTPNAGADRIEGVAVLADGRPVLRLRVAAPPDRGRANAAAIGLLAGALKTPRTAFSVTAGATARLKTLHIAGDPAALGGRLEALGAAKGREIPGADRN